MYILNLMIYKDTMVNFQYGQSVLLDTLDAARKWANQKVALYLDTSDIDFLRSNGYDVEEGPMEYRFAGIDHETLETSETCIRQWYITRK